MLGVMALNSKKIYPVWCPCGYRLIIANYKHVPAHTANCLRVAGVKHEFLTQRLLAAKVA